jgi:hypothetical protein
MVTIATQRFICRCRENTITLSFSDGIPREVVGEVYCPHCEENGYPPQKGWPVPGDWFVHFDLDVARMFTAAKLDIDPALVNPGFIMDRGFVR